MVAEDLERRLAVILCADIVGYSRLIGADEEGTLRRLRDVRAELINPAIQTHHGRIIKTMGDGILVEFASVVDAVRAAVEVQRGVAGRNAKARAEHRIEFRMGIHLGDVMVQADGDLLGDSVNIAARLETIAEPGGVCISEDAYRQVRDRLKEEFVDLGDKQLKNIARPVQVKLLLDPYAKAVVGNLDWNPAVFGYQLESGDDQTFDERDSAPFMPRCRVIDPAFTWGGDRPPRTAWESGTQRPLPHGA
jgi:class 3 adenylate cyclase